MLRFFVVSAALILVASDAAAQRHETSRLEVPLPALVEVDAANVAIRGGHPFLRTVAALAGSAGGFALAEDRSDTDDPNDFLVPIAAGAAGAALGAMIFSNAHPLRIIAGSILAAVPAGALVTYVAKSLDEEDRGSIPLLSFSVPHGLLTSAFSVDRR